MELRIIHSDVYRHVQKQKQITHCIFLGLCISGLKYSVRRCPAGGRVLSAKWPDDPFEPALLLTPKGTEIDFEYDASRENWVIACEIPALHYETGSKGFLLEYRDTRLFLPFVKKIKQSRAGVFRTRFHEITELYKSGVPANLCAAEAKAGDILACFFLDSSSAEKNKTTPAQRFKSLIDSDMHFSKTLSELSREAGYSQEHLRVLFAAQFHTDPVKYRQQKRLHEIIRLMAETDLSLKEITDRVGMKNTTHLYSFLKKMYPVSPKELLEQYRG